MERPHDVTDTRKRLRTSLADETLRRVFDDIVVERPTVWVRAVGGSLANTGSPDRTSAAEAAVGAASGLPGRAESSLPPAAALTPALIDAAEDRFRWFAPLFEELFP